VGAKPQLAEKKKLTIAIWGKKRDVDPTVRGVEGVGGTSVVGIIHFKN